MKIFALVNMCCIVPILVCLKLLLFGTETEEVLTDPNSTFNNSNTKMLNVITK